MPWRTLGMSVESDSPQLNVPRRSPGRVRLPPLSSTKTHNVQSEVERVLHKDMNKSEAGENNLLTPIVYKHPMSPSHLSLQFNFDDVPNSGINTLEKTLNANNRDISPSRCMSRDYKNDSDKRFKSPWLTRPSTNQNGYRKLKSGELKGKLEEKTKVGHYQQLFSTSNVKQSTLHENQKSPRSGKLKNVISSNKLPQSTHLKLDVKTAGLRKGSVYGLREFLSLPVDENNDVTSDNEIKKEGKKTLSAKRGLSKALPQKNILEDSNSHHSSKTDNCKYDIAEFLKLPVQSRNIKPGQDDKTAEKVSKTRTSAISKKIEIPSVVVANWSLENNGSTASGRKDRSQPKRKPRGNKVNQTDHERAANETRRSTYDLHEFLKLPSGSRGATHITTQDLRRLSRELEGKDLGESESDLREFLNVLDSRKLNDTEELSGSVNRTQTSALTDDIYRESRSISLYDIYEILKDANLSNVMDDKLPVRSANQLTYVCGCLENEQKPKASIINLTFSNSSESNRSDTRSINRDGEMENKTNINSSSSTYSLTEFLQLPAGEIDDNKSKNQTRNTFEASGETIPSKPL